MYKSYRNIWIKSEVPILKVPQYPNNFLPSTLIWNYVSAINFKQKMTGSMSCTVHGLLREKIALSVSLISEKCITPKDCLKVSSLVETTCILPAYKKWWFSALRYYYVANWNYSALNGSFKTSLFIHKQVMHKDMLEFYGSIIKCYQCISTCCSKWLMTSSLKSIIP